MFEHIIIEFHYVKNKNNGRRRKQGKLGRGRITERKI